MQRNMVVGVAILAALLGFAAGTKSGGQFFGLHGDASPTNAPMATAAAAMEDRKILYWKHPDGAADFAPAPKKTPDGRDYLAVYDDQEPAVAGSAALPKPKGKLLYYRNPMGLADTSPVPKKDWMGMDYIAVFEGEEQEAGTVKVSVDRVQRSGVRSEAASMRVLARPVRAPGVAKPDDRTLRSVSLRAEGFIERLYVNEIGKHVTAGEPLFRVYMPQLALVQVDYRSAMATAGQGQRTEQGALQRIRNLGIPESVIEKLRASPVPVLTVDWPAPVTGVVMQKPVIEGQMVKPGEEIFRFADLSSIWVIADVAEQDVASVQVGAPATLTFRAYPGEPFTGKVTFILHELDAATRTAKVRIEVKNPEHRIKHEMFADVVIDAGASGRPVLTVPVSSVIDSGNRQVVLVDKGEGRFQPRPVKLGTRGDGYVSILDGLKAGEQVVTAATFLIDAESNLKAALQAFTAPAKEGGAP